MKYIINQIVNEIINAADSSTDELMYIIKGFEDIKIYVDVCTKLSSYFAGKKTCKMKLGDNKYKQFQTQFEGSKDLAILVSKDWVADGNSLTYYRNLHDSDILILMGTESEADQDGLKNISAITPATIINNIPTKTRLVQYSDIFTELPIDSEGDKETINTLYKYLFELVPLDICKLSNLADEMEKKITTINDFISLFYEYLPKWQIPYKADKLPKKKDIKGKNILKPAYDFITRNSFNGKTVTSLHKTYSKKFEKYKTDEKAVYTEEWEGWNTQSIKSYDELKNVILDYAMGFNIESNREKLMGLDFSIIESILGIKNTTEHQPKETILKIYGDPITAFITSIMVILGNFKNNPDTKNIYLKSLNFDVSDIIIPLSKNSSDSDEHEELAKLWQNICIHTNGIFEFLDRIGLQYNQDDFEIKCLQEDLFEIGKLDELLVQSTTKNSVAKVAFNIIAFTDDDKKIELDRTSFEWNFDIDEPWLNNFKDLCQAKFVSLDNDYIPLTTCKNIQSLVSSKSEKEFYDFFLEKTDLDFSTNILDKKYFGSPEFANKEVYYDFKNVGSKFLAFCKELSTNGFYNCCSSKNYCLGNYLKAYNDLGKKLKDSPLNENEKYILNTYIHMFNIEKTNESIVNQKDIKACIVPPWHPSAIEKIYHRLIYITDGFYEYWNNIDKTENAKISMTDFDQKMYELDQMSLYQSAVDLFATAKGQYFGNTATYGYFAIYASSDIEDDPDFSMMLKKEAVFAEDFKESDYKAINDDTRMITSIISEYLKAFPTAYDNLNLVFIDPNDLQPIVSAVHHYIESFDKKYNDKKLNITLKILVKPENEGGKNYLAYWMNTYFDVDSNVNIKTYLNVWTKTKELNKLLDENNDIIFVMNLLKVNDFSFRSDLNKYKLSHDECYFPIVYRPIPISNTSTKRQVELSQAQFETSFNHTQIIQKLKNLEQKNTEDYYAIKTLNIDDDIKELIQTIHSKGYWIVCIDGSLDGAILRESVGAQEFSFIGYSTGKGKYGQYNVTITARDTILNSIKENFKIRLNKIFHWKKEIVEFATDNCMDEAKSLDGISVLGASNYKDYKINEFMAYVLTSLIEKEEAHPTPLKAIINMDSYKHWFEDQEDSFAHLKDEEKSKSRPDFLVLELDSDFNDKVKIKAKVVECKLATYSNKESHMAKATYQANHGVEVLSKLFDPNSNSIKRRYWFAQLYRSLAFNQITFGTASEEFKDLSNKLRNILNGDFEIEWSKQIMGYWADLKGNEIVKENIDDIVLYNVPQMKIQNLLLKNKYSGEISFNDIDTSFFEDSEDYDSKIEKEREKLEEEKRNRKPQPPHIPVGGENESLIVEEETSDEDEILENVDNPTSSGEEVIIEGGEVTKENPDQDESKGESGENSDLETSTENTDDVVESHDEEPQTKDLSKARVYIGDNKFNKPLYWEFGHKKLTNRHALITGASGTGKTYCIQTMLHEITKNNISTVIYDYTDGFTKSQLDSKFLAANNDKINEISVYFNGVPINPFKLQTVQVGGMEGPEKPAAVASRIASIFKHVYGFGDQQYSAIFNAVISGMKKHKGDMDMNYFKEELDNSSSKYAPSVVSKLEPFFMSVEFNQDPEFDWGKVLYSNEGKINIIQLSGIVSEMQIVVTELMLWDMWYYSLHYGSEDKPFAVVLDEAQNLSHKDGSPTTKILTEGRKFGWSGWFATQSLKVLDDDEITRLMQAAFRLYFRPTDNEIVQIAKQIDPDDSSSWVSPIKNLNKGECIMIANGAKEDGSLDAAKPVKVKVASFDKRGL